MFWHLNLFQKKPSDEGCKLSVYKKSTAENRKAEKYWLRTKVDFSRNKPMPPICVCQLLYVFLDAYVECSAIGSASISKWGALQLPVLLCACLLLLHSALHLLQAQDHTYVQLADCGPHLFVDKSPGMYFLLNSRCQTAIQCLTGW